MNLTLILAIGANISELSVWSSLGSGGGGVEIGQGGGGGNGGAVRWGGGVGVGTGSVPSVTIGSRVGRSIVEAEAAMGVT